MGDLREEVAALSRAFAASVVEKARHVPLEQLATMMPTAIVSATTLDALGEQALDLATRHRSLYRDLERVMCSKALERCKGNASAAARLLGIPRKVLVRKAARLRVRTKGSRA